jgi:Mu transposase, C-terminal domain
MAAATVRSRATREVEFNTRLHAFARHWRFRRAEAGALRPIAGTPPFAVSRELVRKVQADCAVEVDGNAYSVPWRLIGETVRVTLAGGQWRVSHAGREGAVHQRCSGRFERLIDPLHFEGVVGFRSPTAVLPEPAGDIADPELLRPLEYERLVGGRW